MEMPSHNLDFGTTSHAHPLPVQSSPSAMREQRVRALIARQSIHVSLHGLSFERFGNVSDILTPKIRRSPFNGEVTSSHLDMTGCWKGLSQSRAAELTMWYQLLHKCLQSEARASLYNDLVEGLLQGEDTIDEVYLIPRMLDHLHGNRHRVIDICFIDLIDSMMGMFHNCFPGAAASVSSNWSHFSGGLSLFLHHFLRIQDCFVESLNGPCLIVDFEYTYADSVLIATGDVTWHLPDVRLLNLPHSRSAGEEYRITPFMLKEFHSPASSPDGCSGYLREYVDQVNYTLPQSSLGFVWDSMKQCFKAVLPDYGDGASHTIETVLKATIITPFPDQARFERQSRWSIRLDIVPTGQNKIATTKRIDKGKSVQRNDLHENELLGKLHCDTLKSRGHSSPIGPKTTSLDHDTTHENIVTNIYNSPFSQKRKVSKPGMAEIDVNAKRRRRDSANENGEWSDRVHRNCSGDEAELSVSHKPKEWSRPDGACIYDDRSNAGHPIVDQCHPYGYKEPLHTWYCHLEQHDSSLSSPDFDPTGSNSPTSNSAIDRGHPAFQQQQILRNYREFAEMKPYKDAGVFSPISEGERKAFESIFLGENEEWSSVTDRSAVDLDTVMGEI